MRAVPLAKTLGVGSFQGLQAAIGSQLGKALGGGGGASAFYTGSTQMQNQAFQHTKVEYILNYLYKTNPM